MVVPRRRFFDEDGKDSDIEINQETIGTYFGCNVFDDSTMKARLPKHTYMALRRTIDEGEPLDLSIAEVVANAMKDWAIERGATHYTHWFQPMTGVTAEKHESFISPTREGKVIMEFSGKELVKGEPDASSFPSGGLRATFEARGYTAWDCTSPAFLKEDASGVTLCIPTAFCSYTGEALDQKTPLLRSMEVLSKQAMRVVKMFNNTKATKVISTVGAEQEYFLIDKKYYKQRKDIIFTGRTLFGAKPPKDQEMESHYYGRIEERVAEFMKELDIELWKIGVPAKTKHNEAAPAQFELASVFTSANVATDHNQLIMETMRKVANRHDLACLLHEKPFAGVNGSGKHNNWSMATDDGDNLLKPGKTPYENARFLLFLSAVIKAIDDYGDLMRVSAAIPGNDHRLGANEAPPAIVSIFLGEVLTDILDKIGSGDIIDFRKKELLKTGVSTMPPLPKDLSDRNRTSPFAFTGNKFEFRMVPSSGSIAMPNTVLNTIVADVLSQIADRLEKADDFDEEVQKTVKDIIKEHKRVIFNGNGYSDEWIKEAKARGLKNTPSTVDAIPALISEKSIKLFETYGVFNRRELESRYEIALEGYINAINIEALTMIDMARKEILPAAIKYQKQIAESINEVKNTGIDIDFGEEAEILKEVSNFISNFNKEIRNLEKCTMDAKDINEGLYEKALYYKDVVFIQMEKLRYIGDKLESIVDEKLWPMPVYSDMLFNLDYSI